MAGLVQSTDDSNGIVWFEYSRKPPPALQLQALFQKELSTTGTLTISVNNGIENHFHAIERLLESYLIIANAPIDQVDTTLLHLLAKSGYTKYLNFILDKSYLQNVIIPLVRDVRGATALDVAIEQQQKPFVESLLKHICTKTPPELRDPLLNSLPALANKFPELVDKIFVELIPLQPSIDIVSEGVNRLDANDFKGNAIKTLPSLTSSSQVFTSYCITLQEPFLWKNHVPVNSTILGKELVPVSAFFVSELIRKLKQRSPSPT